MLFNSLHFLIFFPVVVGVFFALTGKARVYWLIAASCYFYMAFVPAFILILFFLILLDFFAGRCIEGSQGRRRKAWLVASLAGNIGLLGFFKYFNFFNDTVGQVAQALGWGYVGSPLTIILPIGLSFHTFQSMAYVIEVYRGHLKAERDLSIYTLYVLFFPQMVAGPIERPQNLLNQFHHSTTFDHQRAVSGLLLMLVGFFKKLVIADRLAVTVNHVYGDPAAHGGWAVVLATYCFAFQIYCDFSGYSDIATGAARIMGYDLMKNFDRPYAARSIAEFWKRWHISLSSWFRDYLYIPLGGNRAGRTRWYLNLMIVFAVSGLWHGAAWTFVCWGALHGLFLVAGILTEPLRRRATLWLGLDRAPWLLATCQVLLTFHLVAAGWVFFRAASVGDAFHLLAAAVPHRGFFHSPDLGQSGVQLLVALAAIVALEVGQLWATRMNLVEWVRARPPGLRWAIYYSLVVPLLALATFGANEFIYFQF